MPPMALAGDAPPVARPALAHHRLSSPSSARSSLSSTSASDRIPAPSAALIASQQYPPLKPSHAAAFRPAGSLHSSPKPAPAAYPPSGHDSVISSPGSPKQLYSQSASSNSNTSRDARQSLVHSIPVADDDDDDDEKASLSHPTPAVVRNSQPRDMVLDLEKQCYSPASNSRRSGRTQLPVSGVSQDLYLTADPDEAELESKAFKILLHLSGFACLVSFAISLWTLAAVMIAALLQPLRFCSMRPDYREQLVKFLSPSLGLQFRLIYSAPLSSMYNTPLLFLVCLLSPFVAVGIAIASWISASFWIYAAMIGDPGSKDGHNDGREAVLIVRSYWESWLLRALR